MKGLPPIKAHPNGTEGMPKKSDISFGKIDDSGRLFDKAMADRPVGTSSIKVAAKSK